MCAGMSRFIRAEFVGFSEIMSSTCNPALNFIQVNLTMIIQENLVKPLAAHWE